MPPPATKAKRVPRHRRRPKGALESLRGLLLATVMAGLAIDTVSAAAGGESDPVHASELSRAPVPAARARDLLLGRVPGIAPQALPTGVAAVGAMAPVSQGPDLDATLLRPDADGGAAHGAKPVRGSRALVRFDRLPKPSGWMLLVSGLAIALYMILRNHRR